MGLIPLQIIFSEEYRDYRYGETLVTPITNFVPRKIWPDKPESGGVVLTKFAEGRAYTGTSHYSTGMLAESIVNFGYVVGPMFAAGVTLVLSFVIVRFYGRYRRLLCCEWRDASGICARLVRMTFYYLILVQVPGSLLTGEVAATFFALILNVVMFHSVRLVVNVAAEAGGASRIV